MARYASARSVEYRRRTALPTDLTVNNSPYSSLRYPRQKILIAHDRHELTRVMSDFVGIVRTVEHLQLALDRIQHIREGIEQHYLATPATYDVVELRNMATVADLIVRCALQREESRGLHYVEDYPAADDTFLHDTIIEGEPRRE